MSRMSREVMFIIQDEITGQQLAHYDPTNPDNWTWDPQMLRPLDGRPTVFLEIQIFSTKAEAEFVVNHLNHVFQENGNEVNFKILKVEPISGFRIVE
jgi:hypothetical protein